jgi:hypothetical protein
VIAALYLQRVLGYPPLQVGLAFLPAEVITAICSAGVVAKLINRFGARVPLSLSLLLGARGVALFARAPAHGSFLIDVLPGMLLLGVASRVASTPLLLAAMSDVDSRDSGLASGILNTSATLGGTLGLVVLTGLAESRTDVLRERGVDVIGSVNGGITSGLGSVPLSSP